LVEFRRVAAIRKARSIPEGSDQVRTCAVQDFGRSVLRSGSFLTVSPRRAHPLGVRCSFDSGHEHDNSAPRLVPAREMLSHEAMCENAITG
jgi:hypothetical protein